MQYIYKISFSNNQKVYIGKTNNPSKRWREHKNNIKNGINYAIYDAIRKYGIRNTIFEVIATCLENTKECADYCEKLIIKQYDSFGKNGYNMTPGGDGSGCGKEHYNYGKTWKIPESKCRNGEKAPFFNHKHTEEWKNNPTYHASGEKHPNWNQKGKNCKNSKKYRLTFDDQLSIEIDGLLQFCKENGLSYSQLTKMVYGTRKRHKNIIKIEII